MTPRTLVPPGDQDQNSQETGKEGSIEGSKGERLSDIGFHAVAWGTDAQAAQSDLDRLADSEADLAIQRAEANAKADPSAGIRAFQGLIALFPDHAKKPDWEQKIEQLKAQI